MHALLSNLANRQTDKQTNTDKTCTSSFVGGNKRLCSRFCTNKANYWRTRSIARSLCNIRDIVTVAAIAASCIMSEIERDIGQIRDFFIPSAFNASVREDPRRNVAVMFGAGKTRMVCLADGEKVWWYLNRFDRIPACDRRIEGHLTTA